MILNSKHKIQNTYQTTATKEIVKRIHSSTKRLLQRYSLIRIYVCRIFDILIIIFMRLLLQQLVSILQNSKISTSLHCKRDN